MLELILGLFLVSSSIGVTLSKMNDDKAPYRAPRKHATPLKLDKDLFI